MIKWAALGYLRENGTKIKFPSIKSPTGKMYAASETDPKLIEDVIKIYGAIDSLRYSEIAR
jgi:hypothetical protein